jgi:asparagine synthase (glutamine-hydrolysing)
VLGTCAAEQHDVDRALDAADLASVTRTWAGSFTAIRVVEGGAVEVLADAAGAIPLFTTNTPAGAVWGASSLALAGLADRRVDTDWLASYLADKRAPAAGRSAYAGVTPVPAGHRLTLDPAGASTLAAWWSPARRRLDDALPAIRRALVEGVGARVKGMPASADLAGMDSTTLAVLAAGYGPIIGVTAYPPDVPVGGDARYAHALTVPNLTHAPFPLTPAHLPFTPTETPLPATDEPALSTAVWAQFSAQLQAMTAAGSAVHLTGDGGDNLFLPSPTHLADLARRRRYLRLARDARDWARLRRRSPLPLIRAALAGDIQRIARPWLKPPAWVRAPVPAAPPPPGDADAALVSSVRSAARAAATDVQAADCLDVELHNPYFDAAALDAVVSVPSWQRFSAHRYKPLLVEACGDVLPEKHRRRATKGVFARDFHHGLRANLPRLLDLADGRLAALGLIDPAPLRATLRAAALGAETLWAALLPTLNAEAWLAAVETAPPVEWTTPTRAGAP